MTISSNVQTSTQGYWDHKESGKYDSTKEYSKPLVTGLTEMEIQEFPDIEFKIIVLKMLGEKQYKNKVRSSTKR